MAGNGREKVHYLDVHRPRPIATGERALRQRATTSLVVQQSRMAWGPEGRGRGLKRRGLKVRGLKRPPPPDPDPFSGHTLIDEKQHMTGKKGPFNGDSRYSLVQRPGDTPSPVVYGQRRTQRDRTPGMRGMTGPHGEGRQNKGSESRLCGITTVQPDGPSGGPGRGQGPPYGCADERTDVRGG